MLKQMSEFLYLQSSSGTTLLHMYLSSSAGFHSHIELFSLVWPHPDVNTLNKTRKKTWFRINKGGEHRNSAQGQQKGQKAQEKEAWEGAARDATRSRRNMAQDGWNAHSKQLAKSSKTMISQYHRSPRQTENAEANWGPHTLRGAQHSRLFKTNDSKTPRANSAHNRGASSWSTRHGCGISNNWKERIVIWSSNRFRVSAPHTTHLRSKEHLARWSKTSKSWYQRPPRQSKHTEANWSTQTLRGAQNTSLYKMNDTETPSASPGCDWGTTSSSRRNGRGISNVEEESIVLWYGSSPPCVSANLRVMLAGNKDQGTGAQGYRQKLLISRMVRDQGKV